MDRCRDLKHRGWLGDAGKAVSIMAKKKPARGTSTGNGAAAAPEWPTASYCLSLTLRNVRCFGDTPQKLDLSDGQGNPARWTVLLGNNGTGKTTILQALASFELVRVGGQQDSEYRTLRAFLRLQNDTLFRSERSPGSIKATLAIGSPLSDAARRYRSHESRWDQGMASPFPTTTATYLDDQQFLRCYGYGASRRLSSTTLGVPEDADATANLFSDDAPLRNAEEWLLRLDYSALKQSSIQEQQSRRLALVKEVLIDILPEVEDIRFTAPTAARPTPTIEFHTPYGWVGLRQLGHGYRTLIAWMVDFASRLVDRSPDSSNPLAAPAVALIDEIDLHLHPIWQRQLMSHLTRCFPNTQFIVTAHSPLIVQAAAEDANIALLRREGDHVVIDDDVDTIRGWRIDQILTSDLFGLPSARPPQFDRDLERRKEILTKSELTKAEERELAELEARIGPLPVGESAEQARALSAIRETIELLQQNQSKAP
jgi:predicted ATP-binding protein involved in virulence